MAYAILTPVVNKLRRLLATGQPDGSLAIIDDGGEQQEYVGEGGPSVLDLLFDDEGRILLDDDGNPILAG